MRPSLFLVGLDLGKRADFSAAAVVEQSASGRYDARGRALWRYDVRSLMRGELNTPYPSLLASVAALLRRPELRPRWESAPDPGSGAVRLGWAPPPALIVDGTGVGSAVVDMFIEAGLPGPVIPVVLTAGAQARQAPWNGNGPPAWWAPKLDVISSLTVAMQSDRLRVSPGPLADTLLDEMLRFEVRVTRAAREVMGAWREGAHDDLVLALALAVWMGELGTQAAEIGSAFVPADPSWTGAAVPRPGPGGGPGRRVSLGRG
jgi:hypothetical protein